MKVGAFLVDSSGNMLGQEDRSRLDNAKWYQKLWARISKRYKNSLIVLAPLETGLITNNPEDWTKEGILYKIETEDTTGIKQGEVIDEEYIKNKMNESKGKRWVISKP